MSESFTLFTKLPPELRRFIWKLCLPRRVVEGDIPPRTYSGSYSHKWHGCSSFKRNALLPRVASVCREAAQVAREMGHEEVIGHDCDLVVWVQPTLDKAFNAHYYDDEVMCRDPQGKLDSFFYTYAKKVGLDISVVADHAHDFTLSMTGDLKDEQLTVLVVGSQEKSQSGVHDLAWSARYDNYNGKPLYVKLCVVSLHIPQPAAMACDLFGLLGDETVQTVDVDNTARLRAFSNLLQDHGVAEEKSGLRWIFDALLHPSLLPRVQAWKEFSEWLMLAYMWTHERSYVANGSHQGNLKDLYSVWEPTFRPSQIFIRNHEHSFVESHPWVAKARADLWEIRPQLMFRVCHGKCYLLGRWDHLPYYPSIYSS